MKKILLLLALFFAVSNAFAQNALWRKVEASDVALYSKVARDMQPKESLLYSLNLEALKLQLQNAPSRESQQQSNVIVSFPNAKGELQAYKIYEASILAAELAARNPDTRSYVGIGMDEKTATIRFSVSQLGLHTMSFSALDGTSFIDPYTTDRRNYIVYSKANSVSSKNFVCNSVDSDIVANVDNVPQHRSSNSLFKTYRLALACTIEYSAYHVNAAGMNGGTLAQKKAAVLAAMNASMTRVNGVYEKDLAVTMVIIANNDLIINITSDTYTNDDGSAMLNQNQTAVDATIGSANYDIGHVFSTGGGGIAQLGSPCTSSKARGVTGSFAPVGDFFDIDYVAHEMGHQFGANHTFNSDQSSCGGGNRSATSSYEPGSGSTIMAYAGICPPDDVQSNSDAYFHARSLISIMAFINATGNCGVVVANGNTPPVVNTGGNFTIPFGTAFILKGSATDVDNDALTYCWEQYNNQVSNQPPENLSTTGPNFRSLNPSVSPDRYCPKLSDVIANNLVPTWEVVPSVTRIMAWSLVVRDNNVPNGGQTERATMNLTFAAVGPFKVTSQNSVVGWPQNSSQSITWDVAGSDANGINTALVNIKLSTDGGLTFPTTLASNTPNDGNEMITVPNVVSQTCRIMVEAVGNIFYAVNTTPFLIGYQITNTCTNYTYNIPFTLPFSTSFTTKTINVPTAGIITDVNVTINATHPNLQNLYISMIRPSGPLLNIYNQQCAGSANMNVTFDSQGSAFTCASPTQGIYLPPTGVSLNSLNGFSQQGNWQFGFKDLVNADSGTINYITLGVCTQTVSLLANADFEFENFALYPNPNNGNFTIQFNSESTSKINIAVHDLRGRKWDPLESTCRHASLSIL